MLNLSELNDAVIYYLRYYVLCAILDKINYFFSLDPDLKIKKYSELKVYIDLALNFELQNFKLDVVCDYKYRDFDHHPFGFRLFLIDKKGNDVDLGSLYLYNYLRSYLDDDFEIDVYPSWYQDLNKSYEAEIKYNEERAL